MKKILIAMLILLAGIVNADMVQFPDKIDPIGRGQQMWIECDADTGYFYLLAREGDHSFLYHLDEATRQQLFDYIEKYERWNKKATAMKVMIEKPIGSFRAGGFVVKGEAWVPSRKTSDAYAEDTINPKGLPEINVSFVSMLETNHLLALTLPDLETVVGTFYGYEVLLTLEDTVKLKKTLVQSNIDKLLVQHEARKKKQKAIEDQFN